jgi:hypothetical protein
MPFWFTLFLFTLSFVATALLAPKPKLQNAKAGSFKDSSFPITKEGTPVTLFWGTVRLRGPNVLWYGDFYTQAMTQKVKTGLFSSKRVITGYRYFLGMHLGLGLYCPFSAGASFRKIWADDKLLWSGDVAPGPAGEPIYIGQGSAFGGKDRGGGFRGTIRLYSGTFAQTTSSYLLSKLSPQSIVPAYRGLVHAVLERCEVGEQPQVRPLSFEVSMIPEGLGFGAIGDDANPVEILYDILRSDWGRLGIDPALIDTDSFSDGAQVCENEGNGMSIALASPGDASDAIEEILTQIDAILFEEPSTRKITLKMIRDDYDVDDLEVYGPSDISEISNYSAATWQDTKNQVRVIYNSREDEYNDKTAFAQDMSNIGFQGAIKSAEYNFGGITTADNANAIAARELNMLSIPLVKMRILTSRKGFQLRPGDVIAVTWPDFGIEKIIMRVQKFDLGTLEDGEIAIDLIQDRFAVSHTIYASPQPSAFVRPSIEATPIAEQQIIEIPRWLAAQGVIAGDVSFEEDKRLIYLAKQPTASDLLFDALVSIDGGATYSEDSSNAEFAEAALIAEEYGAMDTGPLKIKEVTDSTILANASSTQVRAGANMLIVGDEIIAYETFTDNLDGSYTLNTVWRGLLDTSPRRHEVDARVFFLSNSAIASLGETVFSGGEAVNVKLLSDTVFQKLPEEDADAISVSVEGRAQRAYPPDRVLIEEESYPPSVYTTTPQLSWLRRDRLRSDIAKYTDPDEVPQDNAQDPEETRFVARVKKDGGSWSETDLGTGTTSAVNLGGYGAIDIEVHAERDDDSDLRSLVPFMHSFNAIDPTPLDPYDLSSYPSFTPKGCWGVRKMVSGYSGPIVRIRDTDDDSEQDVYATGQDLNAFTVVGEARVTTLYDQSGEGNNMSQPANSLQPKLVASASPGTKPGVEFNGTSEFLQTEAGTPSSPKAFMAQKPIVLFSGETALVSSDLIGVYGSADTFGRIGVGLDATLLEAFYNGTRKIIGTASSGNLQNCEDFVYVSGGAGLKVYQEGTIKIDESSVGEIQYYSGDNRAMIGKSPSSPNFFAGTLYEAAILSGDLPSATLSALAAPLRTYWR